MVSAPGKVIVFGEHAVVHGKAAIAAAISLRSYLLISTLPESSRTVTLEFPDIGLDHTWDIDSLPWDAFSNPSRHYYDRVTSLEPHLVEAMQPHIANVSPTLPPEKRKIHQNASSSFLYVYLSLGTPDLQPSVFTLRSTIPIGAGLGSSASISVCLSAALLLQTNAIKKPYPRQSAKEARALQEIINRWAFVGEMCIHGNPSGVDNTVATGGKAVVFKREDYQKPPIVIPLKEFPELPLLLVDTHQSRSTATEVAKVGALKKAHPVVTDLLLSSIDRVTESAHSLISSAKFDKNDPANLEYLGELIRINHGLLVSLGVSHPKLERIRELVDHAGIGWTKLTGAGGGGCSITLLRPELEACTLHDLESKLAAENFERFETTLGGDGVGVMDPVDIEGPESLHDMFLKAKGRDGLEGLMAVECAGDRWQFWRG
jgi:mevalonate kinase